MEDDTPEPPPEQPRFLLPKDCKDLVDALRLQQEAAETELAEANDLPPATKSPELMPKTVALPDPVTARSLAAALELKPYQVMSSLMKLDVFATLDTEIDFKTASRLCSLYQVTASKIV